MQPQTFELKLADATLTSWLAVLGILSIFGLAGLIIWATQDFENMLYIGLVLVVGGGGVFLGGRALWRAALVPARVTLTPTELRIQDQRDGPRNLTQTLRLADISTYSYSEVNLNQELRLRLNRADAPRLRLSSPSSYGNTTDFQAMAATFEQLMKNFPSPLDGVARRQKSFLEKPASTYVLVVLTLVLGILFVVVMVSSMPVPIGLLAVVASYISYVVAWRAAAERRNAP